MDTKVQIHEDWVDNARGLGIYLVILGHLVLPEPIEFYIYSFHVPFFFFISGYLFHPQKYTKFSKFINYRVRRLLIPYLGFGFISYIYWIILGRFVGSDISMSDDFLRPLLGILYSIGEDGWLQINIPLWFLTCLFVCECIFYIIQKLFPSKLKLILATIFTSFIGYQLVIFLPFRLPWSSEIALIASIYFLLGFLWQTKQIPKMVLIIALLLHLILFSFNGRVDMNLLVFGNIFYFFLIGISGILGWIWIAKIIPKNSLSRFISENSLLIMALHNLAFSLLKGIQLYILNLPLDHFNGDFLVALIYTTLTLLILLPVSKFTNRFLPKLVGRDYSS